MPCSFVTPLRKPSCTPLITSGRLPFSVRFTLKARPATFTCCTRRAGLWAAIRWTFPFGWTPKATRLSPLEWLPQDTIIFPGANAALRSAFHLKASSTLLAWELYCLGRPVIGETFSHGTLESRLEVWVDDEPRLIERQHLGDGDLTPVAGHPWIGTLLFYPANEEHLDTVRALLAPLGHFAGATLTDELLSVRFLSHDNLICQRVMRDIWQSLRPLLTTKTACSPRIWQT